MNSRAMTVVAEFTKLSTKVRFAEYGKVVNTFPSDRADQSLRISVLP
jgi:hypothetical protein